MNARAHADALAFADNPEARSFNLAPRKPRVVNTVLRTTHISPFGFEMECDFEFYPAVPRTDIDPAEAPIVDLLTVKVGGTQIMRMIECSPELVRMIQSAICEQMEAA